MSAPFLLICLAAATFTALVAGAITAPSENRIIINTPDCQAACEAAGHCSTGLTSCDQQPTCAIGCAIARAVDAGPSSQSDCNKECTAVTGKVPGTGGCLKSYRNLSFQLCAGCQQWKGNQTIPAGDPNPQECGTPSVEHCIEGCSYAHGAQPKPFPPPCQAGSWTCPGEDTPYDTTKVLFAGNFGDGMVLQRGPGKAAVYGTATPSAAVKLVLAAPGTHAASATSAVTVTTTTNVGGSWKVLLPPQSAGTGYTVTATCTGCTNSSAVASASDVAFGDVWMCSGQSNMEVTLRNTFSRNESYAEADAGKYNNIRLFQTWWRANKQPEYILPHFKPSNVQSQAAAVNWTAPTSKTLPTFSAACWYFGKTLADDPALKGVPIGLVGTFIGGTFIEQWIRKEQQPACTETLCGTKDLDAYKCGSLYNGHIAPFVNQTITGLIWYQGENNVRNIAGSVENKTGYACQMASMIADWRATWSATAETTNPLFPFGVTQLAGSCSEGFPQNSGGFRQAQTGGYGKLPNKAMPNTFLGQGYDLGDPFQKGCMKTGACFGWDTPFTFNKTVWYEVSPIHPRPKKPLAERLARAALAQHYYNSASTAAARTATDTSGNGSDVGMTSDDFNNGFSHPVPVLAGCSVSGNTLIVTVGGLGSDVLGSATYNASQAGASAMEVQTISSSPFEDGNGKGGGNYSWTFVDLQRVAANVVAVSFPPGVTDASNVIGLRYAWGDNPCCGDSDRTLYPCPPMSCPLLSAQVKEPVVPFQARVVQGRCVCELPMVCDGSNL